MLNCMQTTSVRIDVATHEELKRLAEQLGTTVGQAVAVAVRCLRQDRIGEELTGPLSGEETSWLDADLG
jgi:antitoxin component of RelBE/YafQ-DinJ toxin-antitoxin module